MRPLIEGFVVAPPLPRLIAATIPRVVDLISLPVATRSIIGPTTTTRRRKKTIGAGVGAAAVAGVANANVNRPPHAAKAKDEEKGEGSEYFPWA